MIPTNHFLKIAFLIVLLAATSRSAQACKVAEILSGDVQLDILVYKDYETAIVRHANFKNDKLFFGSIKGEITVERGGFAVRTAQQEVVGTISPSLTVEGEDCEKQSPITIRRTQRNMFTIHSGGTPVGSISGRLPKNGFGVR